MHWEGGLPVEDKGVDGVEQTEETDTVDNRLADAKTQIRASASRACECGPNHERGHPD